jgi:hypothetical protein
VVHSCIDTGDNLLAKIGQTGKCSQDFVEENLDIRVERKWLVTGSDISGVESSSSVTLVLVAHSCLYNSILFDCFMGLKYTRTDLICERV